MAITAVPARPGRASTPEGQVGALTGGSSRFSLQLHAEATSIGHDAVGVGLPSGRAPPRAENKRGSGIRSRLAGHRGQARAQPRTGGTTTVDHGTDTPPDTARTPRRAMRHRAVGAVSTTRSPAQQARPCRVVDRYMAMPPLEGEPAGAAPPHPPGEVVKEQPPSPGGAGPQQREHR